MDETRSRARRLLAETPYLFDFTYRGAPFAKSLVRESRAETEAGETRTCTFRGGLTVTTRITYHGRGAVEWVNEFAAGATSTFLIEGLWDAAVLLPLPRQEKRPGTAYLPSAEEATRLFVPVGSDLSEAEFSAVRPGRGSFFPPEWLFPGWEKRFSAAGGRSSAGDAPFFNVHYRGEGWFAAVGWSGQWHAEARREENGLMLRTGLEDTHFYLKPGERVCTSSVVLMPYTAPLGESFNLWRRLVKEEFSLIGRPGRAAHAPLCLSLWGGMDSAEMARRIGILNASGVPAEAVWIDAGWYGRSSRSSPDEFEGDWARHTGDWRVNPYLHPDGLSEVTRAIREGGRALLLWVEPERVCANTPVAAAHPEYFFRPCSSGGDLLLNLGREDAFLYCFDTLCGLIEGLGVGWYRQDFNTDPLPVWRENDAPDRRGLSEIRHITGLYRLWDALLERFPSLMIDNCASGGRRIDIETLRRSVPLWRSDMQCPANYAPETAQTHALQYELWLPFSGTGAGRAPDLYRIRSAYAPGLNLGAAFSAKEPFGDAAVLETLAAASREYLRLRPYLSEDFYPLTSPGAQADRWCARQYHRPADGSGAVLCFRRALAPGEAARFPLRGLDPGRTYAFTDADTGEETLLPGALLAGGGLPVDLPQPRSSKLLFYAPVS